MREGSEGKGGRARGGERNKKRNRQKYRRKRRTRKRKRRKHVFKLWEEETEEPADKEEED